MWNSLIDRVVSIVRFNFTEFGYLGLSQNHPFSRSGLIIGAVLLHNCKGLTCLRLFTWCWFRSDISFICSSIRSILNLSSSKRPFITLKSCWLLVWKKNDIFYLRSAWESNKWHSNFCFISFLRILPLSNWLTWYQRIASRHKFEPHQRQAIVSLSMNLYPHSLVLVV